MINGILFRQRTGLPWRDLLPRFGNRKTVYDRHRRWSADGTWERVLRTVQADADVEGRIDWSVVSVDSTVCRAHQHAAGLITACPECWEASAVRPSIALTRRSAGRGVVSRRRFIWRVMEAAAHWLRSSLPDSGVTRHS